MTTGQTGKDRQPTLYGFWLSPYFSMVAQLMHEAGIGFRYDRVSPFNGSTQSTEHLQRNSLGKIPCLRDASGVVIAESLAICRYLARTDAAARRFYPCNDPVACSEVDALNDFLSFSVSGPFFNWFVVGAYFPQAWRMNTEKESSIFSSWSLLMTRMALGRLTNSAKLTPYLMGEQPLLPDFQLFHILELSKTFSGFFNLPTMDLVAGDPTLQGFYDAMKDRPASQKILAAQDGESELTRRELFEEFGESFADMLEPARGALSAMFGHEI